MKRIARVFAFAVLMLATVAAGVLGIAWWQWERATARVYEIADPPLPAVDGAGLAHGRYLYQTRGCLDCHGERGEGTWVLDIPPGRIVATNLTSAGVGANYTPDDFARAIRHGVRPDGTPLLAMPVTDYADMSDADAAALSAHLAALPPVEHSAGDSEIRLLGRVLYLFGRLPLIPAEAIDHAPRTRTSPAVAATVEYGAYAAATCRGCHGNDYAGQRVPGTPPELPEAANLTVLAAKGWSEADFFRLMREGRRPDGSQVHPFMPWRALRQTRDVELQAMWAYFSGLTPQD